MFSLDDNDLRSKTVLGFDVAAEPLTEAQIFEARSCETVLFVGQDLAADQDYDVFVWHEGNNSAVFQGVIAVPELTEEQRQRMLKEMKNKFKSQFVIDLFEPAELPNCRCIAVPYVSIEDRNDLLPFGRKLADIESVQSRLDRATQGPIQVLEPESDNIFRGRVLRASGLALGPERTHILVAKGRELDALGVRYGVRRMGV